MRQIQVSLVFSALILLLACGGGSNKANVTITVSPTTATVYTAQNQQFTATVTNGNASTVTWEVNGLVGGSTTVGTIDGTGLYTAPVSVPNPAGVTIIAIPAEDTTKSATATVTVQLGANLAISPSSLTMNAGAQQTFVVTSNGGAPPPGVTFALSCKSTAPGACGSITADGVFTAPSSPPTGGGNIIVTASAMQGTANFSTSATVTVVGSSQSATGQYAFTLSGKNNGASYHAAGSFTSDGNGNITGGSEDINSGGAVSTVSISGGTYTYSSSDGRIVANVQTSNGNVTWYITLATVSHGFIEYAGSGISASGTVSLQDPTKFSLASISGNYAFRLAGLDLGANNQLAEAGAFTADGNGSVTSGMLDANSGNYSGSGMTVSGTYTTPSSTTGRGTLTLNGLGTQTFAYYIVDATTIKLVETDTTHTSAGDVLQQLNGPYATGNLHGTVALVLGGGTASGSLGIGGLVLFNSGSITSGSIDTNLSGIFTGGQAVASGSYSVTDANSGRTGGSIVLAGSTISFVLYPVSNSQFLMIDVDNNRIAGGVALVTGGGTYTNATLRGTYALHLSGSVGSTPEDVVGALNANGGGAFTGTLDITNSGGNTALLASTYMVGTTSTTTLKSSFANFNSVGFNMYVVDATQVLFLENDTKGVLTGLMQLQQ